MRIIYGDFMKCLNKDCNAGEIEEDDNFCYKCGHWTARGYSFLKQPENIPGILNGNGAKRDDRFLTMISLTLFAFIAFTFIGLYRGEDLFKPLYFVKRKIDNYMYGYNTAIIKTDNIYNKKNINSLEEANQIIDYDLDSQNFKCSYALDTFKLETDIEKAYSIPSVSFCDMSYNEAEKIKNVIDKMYSLFPNMKGALTNISITNAKTKSEYIAYFQPMFQFVNPNEDINFYNKVNKTQILLNSYYFLNENVMSNPIESVVGENWYVKDATWESTISHELGHYITFVIFLRENGLENITFVTKDNENKIYELLKIYESGEFSTNIVNQALNNYNNKYKTNLDLDSFALTISKYAGVKNNDNVLIADETIAEAIHDFYLHGENLSKSSYEIISIIKSKL